MEGRVAVLESENKRTSNDISVLFKIFRDHMKQEEEDRRSIIDELTSMNIKISSQKAFWMGMVFASSAIGSILGAVIGIVMK